MTAYRIVQESLTNVRKHADAAPTTVSVCYLPNRLEVRVRDTGCASNGAVNPGGHGLVGMRERARLLGGRLEISSAPERGTRVVARVPIDLAEAQA